MSIADILPLTSNNTHFRWNTSAPLSTPVFVTYSFGDSRAAYDGDPRPGFAAWTEEHKSYVRQALQVWDATSGIKFLEVPDAAVGQIRFGMYNMDGLSSGFGYYPAYSYMTLGGQSDVIYEVLYDNLGGDIFPNSNLYANSASSFAPGQAGFSILLHEIGHAIGFKHPFEGDPILNPAFDNSAYTVMSYNRPSSATNLGSLDIEASQYYYGQTDASYSWDPSALVLTIDGTSGADYRVGTELRDIIYGLEGDDVLDGGPGDDVLDGGAGADVATFSGLKSDFSIAFDAQIGAMRITDLRPGANEGSDIYRSIERLKFYDATIDAPQPSFIINLLPFAPIMESTTGPVILTVTLQLNTRASTAQNVTYSVSSSGAHSADRFDWVGEAFPSGIVQFLPGQVTQTLQILIKADQSPEHHETFKITLSNPSPGVAIGVSSFEGVILNDDLGAASVGADFLPGTELGDEISGLNGDDKIFAYGGDDRILPGLGNDFVDGGSGIDAVIYANARADAAVDVTAGNIVLISGVVGDDALHNIERVSFNDGDLVYDLPFDADAALVYRIYQASFARTPDEAGFRFWHNVRDQQGVSFYDMADYFRTSTEFIQKYGANVSNNDYVYSLYGNVLQRAPDTPGLLFWQDVLNNGAYDRNELMLAFAGSAENVRLTAPNIDDGYWLT